MYAYFVCITIHTKSFQYIYFQNNTGLVECQNKLEELEASLNSEKKSLVEAEEKVSRYEESLNLEKQIVDDLKKQLQDQEEEKVRTMTPNPLGIIYIYIYISNN